MPFHNEKVSWSTQIQKPHPSSAIKHSTRRVTLFHNAKVPRSGRILKPQPLAIKSSKERVKLFHNEKVLRTESLAFSNQALEGEGDAFS
jgi:hypothetical protein